MRKQRIIALIMTILLTISVSFSRIMPVYADTATLTAGAIDVLYGLLGSAGIIAAHEGTAAEKKAATQEIFNKMSAEEQQRFLAGMSGLEYINTDMTGYKFKNTDTFTYDKDWFFNLAQSAITAIARGFNYVVPDYSTPTDVVTGTFTVSLSDGFFLTDVSATGAGYLLFTSAGLLNYYYIDSDNNVTAHKKHGITYTADASCTYKVYASTNNSVVVGYTITDNGATVVSGSMAGYISGSRGVIFGGNTLGYTEYGQCDMSRLSSVVSTVAVGVVNPGINCDEWSQTMSDTIADNKDVIILDGQDLANYDTADDVRNGIITGVDWTGSTNPDIPVDDGTILGKLDSLLKWLAGFPALVGTAVGNTVIGSGSLDFSKFKNIDLSTVFPFCIPFDLINSFKGFNSVAVEPKWVVDFDQTAMKAGQVELDLTQFDSIFSIVRYFIYAGFVVSLILATRSLVKG